MHQDQTFFKHVPPEAYTNCRDNTYWSARRLKHEPRYLPISLVNQAQCPPIALSDTPTLPPQLPPHMALSDTPTLPPSASSAIASSSPSSLLPLFFSTSSPPLCPPHALLLPPHSTPRGITHLGTTACVSVSILVFQHGPSYLIQPWTSMVRYPKYRNLFWDFI